MRRVAVTCLIVTLLWTLFVPLASAVYAKQVESSAAFPEARPPGGSFCRPRDGQLLDVTPPGFCWPRAAPLGKVQYRLKVTTDDGRAVYESPLLEDPVHVPDRTFAAGGYTWTVEALDSEGKLVDTRPQQSFAIAQGAYAQPWVPPQELLARVPEEHPRLLFPGARLEQVRATLKTSRRAAFESLCRQSDRGLKLKVPPEPDYDEISDPAERRLAYVETFREMRRYHTDGMLHMALMYLVTEEEEYGRAAKALLCGAAEWDPEGISSVMAPYGDEVGLGLAKSAALTYDWIYDLFSESERDKVKDMLIARADQMLRRLQRRDFLNRPESSHDGRLPGYLLEHAIALADQPRAAVWMDYALRAIMTVFPHWAGKDGGWAEGLAYGTGYNTIFITPLESLRAATGVDIWQRPFYRKMPYFFLYNVSPKGEIMGFGDSYDYPVPERAGGLRGLLQFHAELRGDPVLRWWVDLLEDESGRKATLPALPGLILPEVVRPKKPDDLPPDAAFFGVGWAALHTDLTRPEEDLMVTFKSSPYGPVSHSYADQNSFAILKGGKALARPGGSRYPQHGTPFHTKFTQQTVAQNAILVDGQGQINRKGDANGRIVGFESKPHFGYVCGDAAAAYGERLRRCRRHVLLVRPSLVCVIDDLEAPKPAQFQWLMHAFDELELEEADQRFVSRREEALMKVDLITPGGFAFSQTNQWPLNPKTGFPTASRREPAKLWHFTAATRRPAAGRRIAAVMSVGTSKNEPDCHVQRISPHVVEIRTRSADALAVVKINLSVDRAGTSPILEVRCEPTRGKAEVLSVK